MKGTHYKALLAISFLIWFVFFFYVIIEVEKWEVGAEGLFYLACGTSLLLVVSSYLFSKIEEIKIKKVHEKLCNSEKSIIVEEC